MKRTFLSLLLVVGLILLLSFLLLEPTDAHSVAQVTLTSTEQQPYPGPDPHPIPGKIEAEDYDIGGEGVAYHDATLGNEGGEYRSDDVDIEITTDTGDGYNVGWIEEGEWLAYTVEVSSTGLYDIQLRVASAMDRTISETLPVVWTISWTVPLTRVLSSLFMKKFS